MNSKVKSLKMNFVMNALLTMSGFIFPFITFPYISRILLPVGVGKVNTATSFIAYFSMIAQLGIPTYGISACAKIRDDKEKLSKTVHELLFISITMSLISYVMLFLCIFFIPKIYNEKALYFVVSISIFMNSIGMEWLYKALEQYSYITIRSIVFKFLAVLAMFLLVHDTNDYIIYGAISIFASSASNILNLVNIRKYIEVRYIGGYDIKRHFRDVGVFFAMTCAATVYTNLDTVMLAFIAGDSDVGFYSAAVKIKVILVSIVTSLGAVLLPRSSYYVEKKMMDSFYKVTSKAMNFVCIIAIPLAVYFIIYAKQGVYFLSGSLFDGAIIPMQVIMPTLFLIGMTNILGIQVLVPLGLQKYVLYSEIIGAVVDLFLNMLLIPPLKSTGAAIGTLVAELSVLIYQYIIIHKKTEVSFKQIKFYKIIIALLFGVITSLWPLKVFENVFVILMTSALCFFISYFLLLIVLKEKLVLELFGQVYDKYIKKFIKE